MHTKRKITNTKASPWNTWKLTNRYRRPINQFAFPFFLYNGWEIVTITITWKNLTRALSSGLKTPFPISGCKILKTKYTILQ